MSAIAVAVGTVGASVVGGYFSNKSAGKAADAARDSSDAQLAFMREQADKARSDINKYIPAATEARNKGFQNQMNFMSQALPNTMNFMNQGNMNAQNVVYGSMPQIQNAIMGGPVDYGFMKPQQINYQSQLKDLLAGIPSLYQEPVPAISGENVTQNPSVGIKQPVFAGDLYRGNEHSAGRTRDFFYNPTVMR